MSFRRGRQRDVNGVEISCDIQRIIEGSSTRQYRRPFVAGGLGENNGLATMKLLKAVLTLIVFFCGGSGFATEYDGRPTSLSEHLGHRIGTRR